MGAGDWLMASGEARKIHKQTGHGVIIVNAMGKIQKSEVFDGVPYILSKPPAGKPYSKLRNAPGLRPYIVGKTAERWTWKPYKPVPAEVFFTPEELAFAEPFRGAIMVEPNVKAIGHSNKDWGWINWSQLTSAMRLAGIGPIIQCLGPGQRGLNHVVAVGTPTFRHALAVLSVAKAFIGTEGGLMHGAAAVGTPAVILWSEFISPDITGYAMHRNIRHAGKPCGLRTNCRGCRESMAKILPAEVLANLKEILK